MSMKLDKNHTSAYFFSFSLVTRLLVPWNLCVSTFGIFFLAALPHLQHLCLSFVYILFFIRCCFLCSYSIPSHAFRSLFLTRAQCFISLFCSRFCSLTTVFSVDFLLVRLILSPPVNSLWIIYLQIFLST